MSDSFRQVGSDLPGGGSTITPEMCKRTLEITPQPTAVYELEGERAALLAGTPANGTVFETILEVDFYVTKSVLADTGEGNSAKLTISTAAAYANATYGTADPIGEPQYSVQFQELRQRIEAHPACGFLTDFGEIKGSWENWANLTADNWNDATSIPDFLDMSAWSFEDYIGFKRDGIDEYSLYLPIVTRTQSYTRQPADIGKQSGRRNAPPADSYGYIDNYDWLCGPDEFTQRGAKYDRKTSWMACEVVLAKLYSNAR